MNYYILTALIISFAFYNRSEPVKAKPTEILKVMRYKGQFSLILQDKAYDHLNEEELGSLLIHLATDKAN